MNDKLLRKAAIKLKQHKTRVIWVICLCLMASLVGTSTYRSLTKAAEAYSGEPVCGLEEHTHDESCYGEGETVLVCGQEENEGHSHNEACSDGEGNLICGQEEHEGHRHSEECYAAGEPQLVCGKVEHVHTDECYEDPTTPEPKTEEVTEAPAESEKPAEEAEQKETEVKETAEEAEVKEEAEKKKEETKKEAKALEFEKKSGNVTVKVSFEDDKAFREEDMPVTMEVEPIREDSKEYQEYMDQIVDETKITSAEKMFLFDITFVNPKGEAVEPIKPASVSFTSEEIPLLEPEAIEKEEEQLNVVHIPEDGKAEIIESEIKTTEERHDDEKPDVAFEAESFSIYGVVYTVDYFMELDGKTYEYSMTGGTEESLTDILVHLGAFDEDKAEAFVKDVTDVQFSDETLLTTEQNEAGVWMLKSLAPFNTEESLTITLKNGEVFTLVVTDAQTSTNLGDFLSNISISGTAMDSEGNYVVLPDHPYTVTMNFKESTSYQFSNYDTLTYQLPQGVTLPQATDTNINIRVSSAGKTYNVPAHVTASTDGKITVKFDDTNENFHKLESATNVSFNIQLDAIFGSNINNTSWSSQIEKDIVIDTTDYSDVFVAKEGSFDESTGVFTYTVRVNATGNVSNVNVKDVITGDAIIFDNNVTISGNSVTPTNNGASNGFDYTFASMQKDEVITIRYTGHLDTSKVGSNGKITYDQTKNTASVKKGDNPPKTTEYGREISVKPLVKHDATDGETISINDKPYKLHNWVVEYNSPAMVSVRGDTITDSIKSDSVAYMSYYGNITVKVYDRSGTLKDTRTISEPTGSSWNYIIPNDDTAAYHYVFTYQTKTDINAVNASGAAKNLKNEVWVGDNKTEKGVDIPVAEKSKPSITKEVVSHSETEVHWRSRLHVPDDGLDTAVVTDTLPYIYSGNLGLDGNRNLFDLYKNGSLTITGLLPGESYTAEPVDGNDSKKLVITFYKDAQKQQPGLLSNTGGHDIIIELTTTVNQEWVQAGYNYPTSYQSEHTNNIDVNTDTKAQASVKYIKSNIEKYGVDMTGGSYLYRIYVSNPGPGPIVIDDYFDRNLLEIDTSKADKDYNCQFMYVSGEPNTTQMNSGKDISTKVTWSETNDGVHIVADPLPMQPNGERYPVYMITYFLKLKDGVNLDALAAENGGTYDLKNTAKWGEHESSYSFTTKHEFLDKTILQKADKDNDFKVKYRITFNTEKKMLNGGDPMTMTDRLNQNLSLDYASVKFTTDPADTNVPYSVSGDGKETVATYIIPDGTSVVIEYEARVSGSGQNVAYKNTVDIHGEHKEVTDYADTRISGEGQASTAYLRVIKVDGYDANIKLAGVRFKLYSEADANGNRQNLEINENLPPVYEKIVTTDENGILYIDGEKILIHYDVKYYLEEIDPLPHYGRLKDIYQFTLTDKFSDVDYPNYKYFYNDSFQIKNWPLQGLVIGKKVESSLEEDLSKKYNFRVTLLATDENGNVVIENDEPKTDTTVNEKYGDMQFTNGICEFSLGNNEQLSAYSMPKNIHFKVEELDSNGFVVSHSVNDGDAVNGNSYQGVTNNEYTLVTFTNSKHGSLKLRKESDLTGDGASDKIYKIAVKNSEGRYMNLDGSASEGDSPVWVEFRNNEEKTWDQLPVGEYTVEENSDADVEGKSWNWTISGDNGVTVVDKTITVPAGGVTVATINNTYKDKIVISVEKKWEPVPDNGSVTVELRRYAKITKGIINLTLTSQNGGAIQGAVYRLYKNDTATDITGITDVNGKITISNLDVGTYYLEQESTPDGYTMEGHSLTTDTLTVTDTTVEQLLNSEMTNTVLKASGTVTLTLTGYENAPLENGVFTLCNSEGTAIKAGLTTDTEGKIVVENLDAGTYYFQQTGFPAGYKLRSGDDGKTESFTVQDVPGQAQNFAVTKTNQREAKGSVKITLKSAVDNSYISGAGFELYKNNELISNGNTDGNGQLSFDELTDGTYQVKQTSTNDGLDPAKSQSFTIGDDERIDQDIDLEFINNVHVPKGNVTLKLWAKGGKGQWNWVLKNKYTELVAGNEYTIKAKIDSGLYPDNIWLYKDTGEHTQEDSLEQKTFEDFNAECFSENNSIYTFKFMADEDNQIYNIVLVSGWGSDNIRSFELVDPSSSLMAKRINTDIYLSSGAAVSNKAFSLMNPVTDASPASAPDGYADDATFTPIEVTLSGGNWSHTFDPQEKEDAEGYPYYYYVVEKSHTPEDYWVDSYEGGPFNESGKVIITNKMESKGSVKVTKSFSGIESLPEGFQITNNVTDDTFTIGNKKGGSGTTADPYYWEINDLDIGTSVEFTETGYDAEGYSVTVNGSATASTVTAIAAKDPGIASFRNEYEKNPGDLKLTKRVVGDGADALKQFAFEIELTAPAGVTLNSSYEASYSGDSTLQKVNLDEGKVTGINLKKDEVFTIKGLPSGTNYRITESDYSSEGYSSSLPADGVTGTITGGTVAENKVEVTNTFSAGSLVVEKTLEGNATDTTKEFDFKVTFAKAGLNGSHGEYKKGDTETAHVSFSDGSAVIQFTLKGGERVEFANLPVGTTFVVSETSADQDGYVTSVSSAAGTVEDKQVKGTISSTQAITASYVNSKNTVTKEATKVWKNGETTIQWPEDVDKVEFTLFAKVGEAENAVAISDATIAAFFAGIPAVKEVTKDTENLKAEWKDLPDKVLVGNVWKDVEYSIRETKITYAAEEGKDARVVDADVLSDEENNIINQAETVDIHAIKAWLNKDNSSSPPENAKVTFTLMADGKATDHTVEVNGVDETKGGTVEKTGDYEGANWTAYFTKLQKYTSEGKIISYTVKETGTWTGYEIDGKDTVNNGETITNKEKSFTLEIVKIDRNNATIKLKDAEFLLYKIDGTSSTDSKIGKDVKVTTDSDGKAEFTGLAVGYYKVQETKAPAGYLITGDSDFYIEVTDEGIRLLEKGEGSPNSWSKNVISTANVKSFVAEDTDRKATATVTNDAGAELPSTGGIGTGIYTAIGMLLIGFAGVLLLRRKRNEVRNL